MKGSFWIFRQTSRNRVNRLARARCPSPATGWKLVEKIQPFRHESFSCWSRCLSRFAVSRSCIDWLWKSFYTTVHRSCFPFVSCTRVFVFDDTCSSMQLRYQGMWLFWAFVYMHQMVFWQALDLYRHASKCNKQIKICWWPKFQQDASIFSIQCWHWAAQLLLAYSKFVLAAS